MPLAILPAQAKLVLSLCKGLRNYHLKVLQSLEAGDPTYYAVQSLWDDAGTSPNRNQGMKRWRWHEKGIRKVSTRE